MNRKNKERGPFAFVCVYCTYDETFVSVAVLTVDTRLVVLSDWWTGG
jgi:hypothetical protein